MTTPSPTVDLHSDGEHATLVLGGSWRLQQRLPRLVQAERMLDRAPGATQLGFDTSALTDWDSGLVTFIAGLNQLCERRGIACQAEGLP
ncbi:MAG: hypothetical protein PVJ30_08990, partial [Thiohalocapsa sp.]